MPADKYPADLVVTLADFLASDWEQAIAGATRFTAYRSKLADAAKAASEAGDATHSKVLWLLADAASMRLVGSSDNAPFKPMMEFGQDRSPLPEDFADADIAFFQEVVPHVGNNQLRARLADIVWLRKRAPRVPAMALAAVEAYRQAPLTQAAWLDTGRESWARALRLTGSLRAAAGNRFQEMEAELRAALDGATWKTHQLFSKQLADLMHQYGVCHGDAAGVASKLEALGREAEVAGNMPAAGLFFQSASTWYKSARDKAAAAKMTAAEAETWAEQAQARTQGGAPSHIAAATFFENAIQTYRTIPGPERPALRVEDRMEELRALLSAAGQGALGEMQAVKTPGIDISDLVHSSQQAVAGKPAAEALARFCDLAQDFDVAHEREQVLKNLRTSVTEALFGSTFYSRDGRVIAKRPPLSMGPELTEADEETIWAKMVHHHSIATLVVVQGQILPAWHVIRAEHRLPEEEFVEVARRAAIVPKDRVALFGKGLYAGYDRDFVTALHILVPQLENLVRQQLKAAGALTTHFDKRSIETENGLSTLMELPHAVQVFGESFCYEVKALFCSPYGPNLRNELAHGLLDEDACNSTAGIYAWWFMLSLVFANFWNAQRQGLAAVSADEDESRRRQEAAAAQDQDEE